MLPMASGGLAALPQKRFTPKVLPSVAKIDHLQVRPPYFHAK
jgi:hypothetical protein